MLEFWFLLGKALPVMFLFSLTVLVLVFSGSRLSAMLLFFLVSSEYIQLYHCLPTAIHTLLSYVFIPPRYVTWSHSRNYPELGSYSWVTFKKVHEITTTLHLSNGKIRMNIESYNCIQIKDDEEREIVPISTDIAA